MWTGSNEQLNSSSASQSIEGAIPNAEQATQQFPRRTSLPLQLPPQTPQLETSTRNDNQQETVGSIYLSSRCIQRLNREPAAQGSLQRVRQRPQMQRHLRWQPYSVANLFLTPEQSAGDSNRSDRRENILNSYTKRINRLARVQSSPEFELSREVARKRVDGKTPSSRIAPIGPIVKSRSEEELNEAQSSPAGNTLDQLNPMSVDSVILSGFRGMKRSSSSPFARMLAVSLMKCARENKVLDERTVWCRNCDRIPVGPVTGACGHTRCKKCIERYGACPCGCRAPRELFVDILTRQLIDKMFQDCGARYFKSFLSPSRQGPDDNEVVPSTSLATIPTSFPPGSDTLLPAQIPRASSQKSTKLKRLAVTPHAPMTPQVRFKYARALMSAGQLKHAVAHLSRVAIHDHPIAHSARILLVRTLNKLLQCEDRRKLTRQLNRYIKSHATSTWLCGSDLECPLCLQPYLHPITTPCGHTFCRSCIERLIDYKKPCALCQRPLYELDLSMTQETYLVSAALEAINEVKSPQPLDQNVIYIISCTVAFPKVPCPLFIFDPKYWYMIRRVLESGTRTFGMVACDKHGVNCEYGTLLEVRDCVLLENGSFILSTVGVSRFQVIETDVKNGCNVARIEKVVDNVPSDHLTIWKIRHVSWLTRISAVYWLNSVSPNLRASIEAAFGALPDVSCEEKFWETPDGPSWLWWFIAILPLKMEIKILILSTKCVLKRFMAVVRTLEAMQKMPNQVELWSVNFIVRSVMQTGGDNLPRII